MRDLNKLLSSWDKLEVIGLSHRQNKSLMCKIDNIDINIEYQYKTSEMTGETYTLAYLVWVDNHGRRSSLKNQSYGCWGDEQTEFHRWFNEKVYEARKMERAVSDKVSEYIDQLLCDTK